MKKQKYYFYRKTVWPEEYDFYDQANGIAGYLQPRAELKLLLHGTLKQLSEYLETHRLIPRSSKRRAASSAGEIKRSWTQGK